MVSSQKNAIQNSIVKITDLSTSSMLHVINGDEVDNIRRSVNRMSPRRLPGVDRFGKIEVFQISGTDQGVLVDIWNEKYSIFSHVS
jgi:hypothetical protein